MTDILTREPRQTQDAPETETQLLAAARDTLFALLGSGSELSHYRVGLPQRSGVMTVIPIFGPERAKFAPPSVGAKLSKVNTYGDIDLVNDGDSVAIVPLHMGYIQHGAQNHALCRSAFIAAGHSLRLQDACCVQAAQGGYLEGHGQQWFFILPLALRPEALRLRHQEGYNKLWNAIASYNREIGLEARGHLEQVLVRKRATLTQYQSRFERLEGQTGAFFFLGESLVGVEIAPSAAYFRDIWMPLVCFGYGIAAMVAESKTSPDSQPPLEADSLSSLRSALDRSRRDRDNEIAAWLRTASKTGSPKTRTDEARFGNLQLTTLEGDRFSGQTVRDGGQIIYASLFASKAK